MVPNDLVDDEAKERLAELGVEAGDVGEFAETSDLHRFAVGVGRR